MTILLCLFICEVSYGQNIVPGNLSDFNPGNLPYANSGGPNGKGAQIAVPFGITGRGCFNMGNKFELLLSDKDGVFSATPTVIGTVNWHFATFINGLINGGTPEGNGYKLRIRATNPARVIDVPGTISIVNSFATAVVNLESTSRTSGGALGDFAFGTCDYVPNATYIITNNTVSSASVTAKVILDSISKDHASLSFSASQKSTSLQVDEGYYSLIATAILNGTVSTKAYPVLNCRKNFALNLEAGNECIDQEYRIRFVTEGLTSVYRNYPGFIYRVGWGDNGKDSVNISELRDSLGKIGHIYKRNTSSCGIDFKDEVFGNTYYNRYKVIITGEMPYCDPEITVKPARVSKPPVIEVIVPAQNLCIGEIAFENKSKPGESPNSQENQSDCSGKTSYFFTVINPQGNIEKLDGYKYEFDVPSGGKPELFKHKFLQHGQYRLRVSASTGGCPSDTSYLFCVSAKPNPVFKIKSTSTYCVKGATSARIEVKNDTNIDSLCSPFLYKWELLTKAGDVINQPTYKILPSSSAREPVIEITQKGEYQLRLSVGSSANCGLFSTSDTIYINEQATVSLNKKIPPLCPNIIVDAAVLKPVYSQSFGTPQYTWTITPPIGQDTSSFRITGAELPEPKIIFKSAGRYKVEIEYKNECNSPNDFTYIDVIPSFVFKKEDRLNDILLCDVDTTKSLELEIIGVVPPADHHGRWSILEVPDDKTKDSVTIYSPIINKTKVKFPIVKGSPDYYKLVWTITNGAFCDATDTIIIKFTPKLIPGAVVRGNRMLCAGDVDTLTLKGYAGEILRWEFSVNGIKWDTISSSKNILIRKIPASAYYRAVLTACGTDIVYSQQLYVPVKLLPKPGNITGSQYVCEGESGTLILKDVEEDTKLIWKRRELGNLNWETISGQSSATFQYTSLTKTTEFQVEVSKDDCPSFSPILKVVVNKKPVLLSDSTTICSSLTDYAVLNLGILKDSTVAESIKIKYNWSIAESDIMGAASLNENVLKFIPKNPDKKHRVLRFKITPVYLFPSGECAGVEGVMQVTVIPNIAFLEPGKPLTVCSGAEITLSSKTDAAPLVDGAEVGYRYTIANGNLSVRSSTDAEIVFVANHSKQQILDKITITPYYRYNNKECIGTAKSYDITISPGANAGGDATICADSYTFKADSVSNVSGVWSVTPFDGVKFDDPTKGKTTVRGLKRGTSYEFKWKLSSGTCNEDEMEVFVIDTVKARFTKSTIGSCEPQEVTFTNTSTPQNGLNYKWYLNGILVPSTSLNLKLSADQLKRDTVGDKEYEDTFHVVKLIAEYPSCQVSTFLDTIVTYAQLKAGITEKDNITKICGKKEIVLMNTTKVSATVKTDYKIEVFNSAKEIIYTLITSDFVSQKVTLPEVLNPDTYTIVLGAKNDCHPDYSYDTLTVLAFPKSIISGLNIASNYLYGCGPHTIKIENSTKGADRYRYEIFKYKKLAADSLTLLYSKIANKADSWTYTIDEGGEYRVMLTSSNSGCASEVTQHIDITVGASNAKFGLSRPDKTYCVGELIGITFPGGKVDNYTWDYGDGTFDGTNEPKKQYSKPGVYIIKARGTKYLMGFECISDHSDTVTIIDKPKASFTKNAAASNCAPFVLNVKSTTANALFVEWDFGDPSSQTNTASGENAIHQYNTSGTYTVKMTVYNQGSCVDFTTQTIVVNPTPTAGIIASKELVCGTSDIINFKAANNSGHTGLVYEWSIQDNSSVIIPKAQSVNIPFTLPTGITPPYTDIIRLIVKNPFTGCSDTTYQEIEYKAKPEPAFTVLNALTDCVPLKISVRNDTKFKNYVDQYEWELDGEIYLGENPVFPDLDIPNKVYRLKLRVFNYDCNYIKETAEVLITTRPLPLADFELKETEGCKGQATFELQSNNSTLPASAPGLTYRWIIDGVPHSNLYNPPTKLLFKGEHKIQFIVSNGFCSDTTEKTISVINLEKPQIIASAITGCGSQPVLFSSRYITDAKKFFWDFGDGYTDTVKNPVHVFYSNAAGKPYFVKLRVTNGNCFYDSEPVQIDIYSKPLVDFQALPDSVIKMPNFTFPFLNLSENKQNTTYTYNWSFGDGGTSKDREPSHTYSTYGAFKVTLRIINEFGCDSSITRNVKIDSIRCFMSVPNAFQPNNNTPALQEFKPKAVGLKADTYRMTIYSRYGEKIFETKKLDTGGIPMEGWKGFLSDGSTPAPQGVYIWDIQGEFYDDTIWPGMSFSGPNGKKVRTGTLTLIR